MKTLLPTDMNSDEFKNFADMTRAQKREYERLSDYEICLCACAYNHEVQNKKLSGSQKRKLKRHITGEIKTCRTREEIEQWCKLHPITVCTDADEVKRQMEASEAEYESKIAPQISNGNVTTE